MEQKTPKVSDLMLAKQTNNPLEQKLAKITSSVVMVTMTSYGLNEKGTPHRPPQVRVWGNDWVDVKVDNANLIEKDVALVLSHFVDHGYSVVDSQFQTGGWNDNPQGNASYGYKQIIKSWTLSKAK
jgi:hypothetical protein